MKNINLAPLPSPLLAHCVHEPEYLDRAFKLLASWRSGTISAGELERELEVLEIQLEDLVFMEGEAS